MWDVNEIITDLDTLRAFLGLRDPLDRLRFGKVGPGQREPTAEEVRHRAVAFVMSAMRLSQDVAEFQALMADIDRTYYEALVQLGYAAAGSERTSPHSPTSWLPFAGRIAYDAPLLVAGLVGLLFFGAAGILAGVVVQPQYVPVLRALLFAAGFLGAFNRLFMPVTWPVWIRAFAWLSLPPIAWITLSRLGQLASAREVLNPGFLPAVPWALALLGICVGVRILRHAARSAGLGRTLVYFDPAIRGQVAPTSTPALPSGAGLVRSSPNGMKSPTDGWRALVSLALVILGVGSALWVEGSGTVRGMRDREIAAQAAAQKERADRAAQEARDEEARREADERRKNEIEELAKAKAAKEKEVQELNERLEREKEEAARKQREIDRLNTTDTTALEAPSVMFLSPDEEADPVRARGIVQVAPGGGWELLAPLDGRTHRVIVRGRYTESGGVMAMLPDSLKTDEQVSDEALARAEASMTKYSFQMKGGAFHPNRPGRFRPIVITGAGETTNAFRWSPGRGETAWWGTYVALNPRPGTDVRISLVDRSATVAVAPSGETWKARVDRREGYSRLVSQTSDLPSFLVWDEGMKRLYLFLGPALDEQPFVLVMQREKDFIKRGR